MTDGLPISPDVLYNDLDMAVAILTKWKDTPIPGEDIPAASDARQRWLQQLIGELQLVAAKCDTLADVLSTASG